MRKPSLLKALTIATGLSCCSFKETALQVHNRLKLPADNQLFSGEINVQTRPGVMERRPVIIRIDTQSGNTWAMTRPSRTGADQ